jgi:hypothetical protein
MIGRTGGVKRLRSDASFAQLAGTAAIPCSSAQRTQHRLNRGGDRQLNSRYTSSRSPARGATPSLTSTSLARKPNA